jgi:hypothetical protein
MMEEGGDDVVVFGRRFDGLPARSSLPPSPDGVHWYNFLVEHRSNSLLSCEPYTKPNVEFLVATEIPAGGGGRTAAASRRVYAKFPSNAHFFGWFQNVRPEDRCCYEIIMAHARQKPYFDIDLPVEAAVAAGMSNVDEVDAIVGRFTLEVLKFISLKYRAVLPSSSLQPPPLQPLQPMCFVFTSHSLTKYSYHILINGVSFANGAENKSFFVAARQHASVSIPGKAASAVLQALDEQVYGSKQNFRIAGCQKYGSNGRFKTLIKDSKCFELSWEPPLKDRQRDYRWFTATLVTDLSGTIPITTTDHHQTPPALAFSPTPRCRGGGGGDLCSGGGVSDDVASSIAQLVFDHIGHGSHRAFRVRPGGSTCGSTGMIIPLERLMPSFCVECQRVHEHENPFIVVNGHQTAYFRCRRFTPDGGGRRFTPDGGGRRFTPDGGGRRRFTTGVRLPPSLLLTTTTIDVHDEYVCDDEAVSAAAAVDLDCAEDVDDADDITTPDSFFSETQQSPDVVAAIRDALAVAAAVATSGKKRLRDATLAFLPPKPTRRQIARERENY